MPDNANGAKAIAALAALAALVMAIAAIVRPQQQQIDALEKANERIMYEARHDLDAHTDNFGHRTLGSDIATLRQRFAEVEAQFRGLRELVESQLETNDEKIESIGEWLDWWHKTVPGLDARQNTRLEALERSTSAGNETIGG